MSDATDAACKDMQNLRAFRSIARIALCLDDGAAEQDIDAALDGGPLVVDPINGSREIYKAFAEVAVALVIADVVLDRPQCRIGGFQFSDQLGERRTIRDILTKCLRDHGMLAAHVHELGRVRHANKFDFEDGHLVDELAGRDLDRDSHGSKGTPRRRAAPSLLLNVTFEQHRNSSMSCHGLPQISRTKKKMNNIHI